MSADLRGFRYELGPLAELEASRLQIEFGDLARASASCKQAELALQQAREAVQRFIAGLAAGRAGDRLDPALSQMTTRYMSRLNHAVQTVQTRCVALERERVAAFERWDACRRRVEQIDAHRAAAAAAYGHEHAAREFARADDDWIIRRGLGDDAYDDHRV
jgi:multidrug resistance efflux pump